MGVIQRIVKPKTQAGKRALVKRAPKIKENDKKCIFINGLNTSNIGREFLKCIYGFKAQNSLYLGRKNPILPFDDYQKLEWLSKKHDTSLFAITTKSKKRPDNLILGRMYNHQVLDMIEMGITDWKALSDFHKCRVSRGTKPCILFHGVAFTQSPEHMRLKSLLLDFFRGPEVKNIRLAGFELAIQFTLFEGKVYMRCYRIYLQNSGTELPRVELEQIAPSLTLQLRRTQLATDDLLKAACRKPKALKAKKKKNITRTPLGSTLGRIHMQKQHLKDLQVRKTPAIKKAKMMQIQRKKVARAMETSFKVVDAAPK